MAGAGVALAIAASWLGVAAAVPASDAAGTRAQVAGGPISPVAADRSPEIAGPPAAVDPAVAAAVARGEAVAILVHPRWAGAPGDAGTSARGARPADALAARRAGFAAAAAGVVDVLAAEAAAGRASAARELWLAGAVAVTADPEAVRRLAGRPDVRLIEPDRLASAEPWDPGPGAPVPGTGRDGVLWNVDMVRADDAWRRLGIDGTGVTIGILDSGVDYHHPDLAERYRGHVGTGRPSNADNWWCKSTDFLCGSSPLYPTDGVGHGTHVAGTGLAPRGIGVAPGARWIAARVCTQPDYCPTSWILEGLQWMIDRPAERRPDVVNVSLSLYDTLAMHQAVRAVHAAGIVLVAASGNEPAALQAPASYSETLTVGAVAETGALWPRSSRGRSSSGEVKPDIVAPGLLVTSTIPGGGYARNTGTSMASPHVAGAAALLLQARPGLSPDAVAAVLRRTATRLGSVSPDPGTGWGLLNAYGAVLSVSDTGQLRGRVSDARDGTPVPWAEVRLATPLGEPLSRAEVDPDGRYVLDVAEGSYLLTATAFTYRESLVDTTVRPGVTTTVDFALEPDEPMGLLTGRLVDDRTGAGVEGTLRLEGVPERFAIPADRNTGFARRLPPGTYRIRVAEFGYRVLTDTIKIDGGAFVEREYHLIPAPRMLLVDADAWTYGGTIDYYRASLDRLGYVYHVHRITNEAAGAGKPGGAPSSQLLAGYDLVVWSSAVTGPTFVGGARALSAYLTGGGRLVISGQDAMCTDARSAVPGDGCNNKARPDPWVRDQLFVDVVADDAGHRRVSGTRGGPLDGLSWDLGGPDSADNQVMPDALALRDPLHASTVATYPDGRAAAVLAGTCTPYRAAVLGFGLEGVRGARTRDELLSRLVRAVTAPLPARDLHARARPSDLTRPAGATAEYTVTLFGTGAEFTPVEVSVADARWLVTLWQPGWTGPLGPMQVGPCSGTSFGVRVQVPEDARRGEVVTTTLRLAMPDGERRVDLVTRTPAAVLLVDGDFGRDSEAGYKNALRHAGVPFDDWELGLLASYPRLPKAADMAGYSAVVWFTGDDWRPSGTLPLATQADLARYLDAGGRLLLSSEEYLSVRGGVPYDGRHLFHRGYLGAEDFIVNAGAVHGKTVTGAPGSILEGLACQVSERRPGEDFSDWLVTTSPGGRPSLQTSLGMTVATEAVTASSRALFLAFDAASLDPECMIDVTARAMDWFSPLHPSTLSLDGGRRSTFESGDEAHLRLDVRNDTDRRLRHVSVRWRLPDGADVSIRDVPAGWVYDAAERTLRWFGDLDPRARLSPAPAVTLTLAADLPDHSVMVSSAELVADGLPILRRAAWRVNSPDLGESTKSVPDGQRVLGVGDAVPFSINVRNTGTRPAESFVVTDTLPAGLALVPGSVLVDGGEVDEDVALGRLVWRGAIAPGRAAALTYRARVVTYHGGDLRNLAVVDDGHGRTVRITASVFARPMLAFPWAGREPDPDSRAAPIP